MDFPSVGTFPSDSGNLTLGARLIAGYYNEWSAWKFESGLGLVRSLSRDRKSYDFCF
jgi:hypothetical protein